MISAILALVIMIFVLLLVLLAAAACLWNRMGEILDFLAAIAVKTGVKIEDLEALHKRRMGRRL